jgi:hypothetical protein
MIDGLPGTMVEARFNGVRHNPLKNKLAITGARMKMWDRFAPSIKT